MILVLWAIVAGANLVLSLLGPNSGADTPTMLGTNLCGLAVALALSVATQRVIERRMRLPWLLLAVLVVGGGTTVWLLDGALQYWVGAHGSRLVPPWSRFVTIRYNWVYFNLIFALQTAALALLTSSQLLAARERQLIEARLAALRLQLNPHFLFNTLNAIMTLVAEARTDEAEEMISRLSTFLRTSLALEPGDFIPLESELDTVQAYLEIEAVRFGERLDVRFVCAEDLQDALVPNLILQPLVENAVKYGVAASKTLVTVQVEASASGGELKLVVEDDGSAEGAASNPSGTGVGLRNVAGRLEALYGAEGRMQVLASRDGFRVELQLPLRRPAGTAHAC